MKKKITDRPVFHTKEYPAPPEVKKKIEEENKNFLFNPSVQDEEDARMVAEAIMATPAVISQIFGPTALAGVESISKRDDIDSNLKAKAGIDFIVVYQIQGSRIAFCLRVEQFDYPLLDGEGKPHEIRTSRFNFRRSIERGNQENFARMLAVHEYLCEHPEVSQRIGFIGPLLSMRIAREPCRRIMAAIADELLNGRYHCFAQEQVPDLAAVVNFVKSDLRRQLCDMIPELVGEYCGTYFFWKEDRARSATRYLKSTLYKALAGEEDISKAIHLAKEYLKKIEADIDKQSIDVQAKDIMRQLIDAVLEIFRLLFS